MAIKETKMISKKVKIFSVSLVTFSALASSAVLIFGEPTSFQVASALVSYLGAGIVYAMAGIF